MFAKRYGKKVIPSKVKIGRYSNFSKNSFAHHVVLLNWVSVNGKDMNKRFSSRTNLIGQLINMSLFEQFRIEKRNNLIYLG